MDNPSNEQNVSRPEQPETESRRTESKAQSRRREPVRARLIADYERGKSLVEFEEDGDLRRVVIPRKGLDPSDGVVDVDPEVLRNGEAYGDPFEDMLSVSISPESIARELRRNGIWTADDLSKMPKQLQGAFYAALSNDVQNFIRAAEEHAESTRKGEE